jgi:dTDP-4-amino-4,6-dideoxygalactose transaminase
MKVEFFRHSIGEEEKAKVCECLDGIFLTAGSYVKDFEEGFGKYTGLRHVVGLNSCTAALHLSLVALGIGAGDEVITSPMTFIATATSIIHTGAIPVFVDVDPHTGLIDPGKIERAITKRTKAIIAVHLYGQMCDMRAIKGIAERRGLKIVEDSAHCIEGERDCTRPGELGDIACFSFYATKNITSGEGGAVGTNKPELAEKVLLLRQHGMSKEAADRHSGNYQHWDMLECGWKYNMDNIQAAMLLPQLGKIEKYWRRRREVYDRYIDGLEGICEIRYPRIAQGSKSSLHLFTIWVDEGKRDSVLEEMGRRGVGVAVNYRAIHLLKYFRERFAYRKGMYPNAERIGECTISLPLYPGLSDEEIGYVIGSVKTAVTATSRPGSWGLQGQG